MTVDMRKLLLDQSPVVSVRGLHAGSLSGTACADAKSRLCDLEATLEHAKAVAAIEKKNSEAHLKPAKTLAFLPRAVSVEYRSVLLYKALGIMEKRWRRDSTLQFLFKSKTDYAH